MTVSIVTISTMLRKRTRAFFPIVFLIGGSLLLTACIPPQSRLPVEPGSSHPDSEADQASVETYAFEQDANIQSSANPFNLEATDPWLLVEQAQNKITLERDNDLLHAVALFLDQRHYSTALSLLEQINTRQAGTSALNQEQKTYSALLKARYLLLNGHLANASALVDQIKAKGSMSEENYTRWLQIDIAIASQKNMATRALISRLALDDILSRYEKLSSFQLQNQRKILNLLASSQPLLSTQVLPTENKNLAAWIELAKLKRDRQLDSVGFSAWHQRHPDHPARIDLLDTALSQGPSSDSKIALLLPMTSKLGRAAQAFKTGFDDAIKAAGRFDNSRVYDIGVETALVPLYYRNAVNDGADVIIGPLGRSGVQSMLDFLKNGDAPHLPTLILGELPTEFSATPDIWGLSLSAEQDATAIAERAVAQGYRQAIVIQKNNAWGARLNAAFSEAFEAKGGKVVANQRYLPNEVDHTVHVKNLLNIQASETRHTRLQNVLGKKLKFSVRRRDDIDFVFLAGNAKDARHILPLFRFYNAHNMPVFATSSVHTGAFNKFTDEDLKGIRFSELPWLLNAVVSTQYDIRPAVQNALPYSNATLNRLYALGYAAYEALPQLGQLQATDLTEIRTKTMSLRLDKNRNLIHAIAWGRYTGTGISMTP